jgi:hypothetical protein
MYKHASDKNPGENLSASDENNDSESEVHAGADE